MSLRKNPIFIVAFFALSDFLAPTTNQVNFSIGDNQASLSIANFNDMTDLLVTLFPRAHTLSPSQGSPSPEI
jgi:hypothetical protein